MSRAIRASFKKSWTIAAALPLLLLAMACGESGTEPTPPAEVASVQVSPAQQALLVGDRQDYAARALDARGQEIVGRAVAWSSSNPAVATVSETGAVTALAAGNVEIRATIDGKTGSGQLTVSLAPVANVEITPTQLNMVAGDTATLAVVAKDAAGRALTGRAALYGSSDVAVATVDAHGRVTAVQNGQATVTVTVEGKSASLPVKVAAPAVTFVGVTPTALVLEIGESRQMTAIVKDAAGNILQGRAIQWTVSAGATISPSGLVTATRQGYLTIRATSEGVSGAVGATVTEAEPYEYDLLYHRSLATGQSELFIVSPGTGTLPIRINAGAVSRNATPSPDGARVAFAASQEDLTTGQRVDDIFAVDVNGLNMKRLTSAAGVDDEPAWSPVGGRIAYSHYEINGRSDIWVMNADGSGQVNLTADMPATGFRSSPAWSADGTRLAFAQKESGANGTAASIWTMRADGTDKREVTSTLSGFDSAPTWSPDGLSIAFMRYYFGDADIAIVDAGGGTVRRIALPGLQYAPAWSPDGRWIAFAQDEGTITNIHTMRPDGTELRLRTLDRLWGGGLAPAWILKR